jgi:hypothetical protein
MSQKLYRIRRRFTKISRSLRYNTKANLREVLRENHEENVMISDYFCNKCEFVSIGGRNGEYYCLKLHEPIFKNKDVENCFEEIKPRIVENPPLKWYQK